MCVLRGLLMQIMTYFVGLPDGRGRHLSVSDRISRNGVEFVERHWRDADWEVYLARLLIEWQRVVWRD